MSWRALDCSDQTQDTVFMARALRLAERGRYSTQPNPRVGCVIVKQGEIIAEGFHQRAGEAHAEINALAQAGDAANGADVYVTLEPCSHFGKTPPCAKALIEAKVARVLIAMSDPNPQVSGKGIEMLEQAGISTLLGICEQDARSLNKGFIKRMHTGLPYVRLKLATSLDGRTAMRSGESVWITSPEARVDVHRLRLESCAIISGVNTIEVDNPRFNVRLKDTDIDVQYCISGRTPIRVVLDSQRRTQAQAKIFSQAGETWQMVARGSQPAATESADQIIEIPADQAGLNLAAVLSYLGQHQMNDVLVEAGGTLAASFIKAGLVDELIVYQSPDVMGSSACAMINIPEILKMSEKIRFEYQDVRKIGRDLKLVLTPNARTHPK